MRLSPALHVLEVALRNDMHNAFSAKYETERWYDRGALLGYKQIGQIAIARTTLQKAQTETPDRLVAELTMGFWVGLFAGYYESFWRANPDLLKAIFPRAPRHLRQRSAINALLQPLRTLRNRVSHWERVTHLPDLAQRKQDIDRVVRSLCPAAACLLAHCDPFDGALSTAAFKACRTKVQPCFEPETT